MFSAEQWSVMVQSQLNQSMANGQRQGQEQRQAKDGGTSKGKGVKRKGGQAGEGQEEQETITMPVDGYDWYSLIDMWSQCYAAEREKEMRAGKLSPASMAMAEKMGLAHLYQGREEGGSHAEEQRQGQGGWQENMSNSAMSPESLAEAAAALGQLFGGAASGGEGGGRGGSGQQQVSLENFS